MIGATAITLTTTGVAMALVPLIVGMLARVRGLRPVEGGAARSAGWFLLDARVTRGAGPVDLARGRSDTGD